MPRDSATQTQSRADQGKKCLSGRLIPSRPRKRLRPSLCSERSTRGTQYPAGGVLIPILPCPCPRLAPLSKGSLPNFLCLPSDLCPVPESQPPSSGPKRGSCPKDLAKKARSGGWDPQF